MDYNSVGVNPSLFKTFKSGSVLKKAHTTKYVGNIIWNNLKSKVVPTISKRANNKYKALKPVQAFQFLKFNTQGGRSPT